MGVVYRVYDRERAAHVALKTLKTLSGDAVFRFKNEFRALQDVQHPNLVTLGELIEHDGQWLLTMELVDGESFLDYVRPGPRPRAALGTSRSGSPVRALDDTVRSMAEIVEGTLEAGPIASFDEERLRSATAQLVSGLAALHHATTTARRESGPGAARGTDG